MSTSYLDRYCQGAYDEVYTELVALGPAVFQESVLADAHAVAGEMLRRVRFNLEHLIRGLRALGYRFADEHPTGRHDIFAARYPRALAQIEQRGILPPVSIHVLYQLYGKHPPLDIETDDGLRQVAAAVAQAYHGVPPHPVHAGPMWYHPSAHLRTQLTTLEQRYGPLPLTLRRWYETIGEVNLIGYHPTFSWWAKGASIANYPLDIAFDDAIESVDDADASAEFVLAYAEGHAWIATPLPQARFDAQLSLWEGADSIAFIPYLRSCFAWGGFPALQHNTARAREAQQHIAELTHAFLPF